MRYTRVGLRAALAALYAVLSVHACGDGPTLPPPSFAPGGGSGDVAVSATSPDNAPQDTTLDVEITGSGFDQGSVADWGIDGVPSAKVRTNATRYVSSKKLVANITIALDAEPVLYDVMVTTSRGKKGIGTELFAVQPKGHSQPPADPVIVFLDYNRGANDRLMVTNADGSNQAVIHTAPHLMRPSWSPDGGSIVFRQGTESYGELWVVDVAIGADGRPEGRNARLLASACPGNLPFFIECEPAWSPGGAEIAFTVSGGLWAVPAGGGAATLLYSEKRVGSPTWSPDGNRLAVVESLTVITILDVIRDVSGSVTGASVSRKVSLTADFGLLADLDWSRTNADMLAFSGLPAGSRRTVYTLDLAQPAPLPERIVEGDDPTWSHDDAKLAFILGTQQKLTVVDLSTGQTVTLTADALDPDWTRRAPR